MRMKEAGLKVRNPFPFSSERKASTGKRDEILGRKVCVARKLPELNKCSSDQIESILDRIESNRMDGNRNRC